MGWNHQLVLYIYIYTWIFQASCVKFVPKFTSNNYQVWQKFYISGRYIHIYIFTFRDVFVVCIYVDHSRAPTLFFARPYEPMRIPYHLALGLGFWIASCSSYDCILAQGYTPKPCVFVFAIHNAWHLYICIYFSTDTYKIRCLPRSMASKSNKFPVGRPGWIPTSSTSRSWRDTLGVRKSR